MSDPLFFPPSLSASGVLASSTDSSADSLCSSASPESSTPSASTRLSPFSETDEHDVGEVGVGGSWSLFNSLKEASAGADDTELMLYLRDLGFTELEGDGAGTTEADRTEDVDGGDEGVGTERFEEAETERVGGIEVERVRGNLAKRLEAAEAERLEAAEAETEVRVMEGEECITVRPRIEGANGCQVREEGVNFLGESMVVNEYQVRGAICEIRGKAVVEVRERKACRAEGEFVVESSRALTMVENLTKSLGLGSSTDSDEEETGDEKLGADIFLAIVAEERHSVNIEELGGMDESKGLTEEIGVVRREALDPRMLDDEWRQKTLALNGEDIANSIYHIPKGYRLHLSPEGSFIHDPPEGHVGVYLKHLEFGLRFPLVDEMVQIISLMGLSLGQLAPQSIRVIVAYV